MLQIKRAAGFNLSTGLVAPDLHQFLSERKLVGIAVCPGEYTSEGGKKGAVRNYTSKESQESRAKTRAIAIAEKGPVRVCTGCKKKFRQSTKFGLTKFCSISCRKEFYSMEGKILSKKRVIKGSE